MQYLVNKKSTLINYLKHQVIKENKALKKYWKFS